MQRLSASSMLSVALHCAVLFHWNIVCSYKTYWMQYSHLLAVLRIQHNVKIWGDGRLYCLELLRYDPVLLKTMRSTMAYKYLVLSMLESRLLVTHTYYLKFSSSVVNTFLHSCVIRWTIRLTKSTTVQLMLKLKSRIWDYINRVSFTFMLQKELACWSLHSFGFCIAQLAADIKKISQKGCSTPLSWSLYFF